MIVNGFGPGAAVRRLSGGRKAVITAARLFTADNIDPVTITLHSTLPSAVLCAVAGAESCVTLLMEAEELSSGRPCRPIISYEPLLQLIDFVPKCDSCQ